MNRGFFFISVFIILASIVAIYYSLGGFEPIEPALSETSGYTIAGKFFEGKYSDPEIKELFFQMKERIEQKELPGPLVIVNFQTDGNDNEAIKYLIGSMLPFEETLSGLSSFDVAPGPVVEVGIEAHNLVMPRPEKVRREIKEFAEKKGYELGDYSVEQYVSSRCLVVEVPVIN